MTRHILQALLNEVVHDLKGESGQWRFTDGGVEMALLTSVAHDRMRIIAPVGPEAELTDQQRKRILEANFHSALDAQYATSNGIVYAAYLHPLSPPTARRSALWTPAGGSTCQDVGNDLFEQRPLIWSPKPTK